MLGDALVVPLSGSGWKRRLATGTVLLFLIQREALALGRFVSGPYTVGFNRPTGLVLAGAIVAVLSVVVLAGYHVRVLASGAAASSTLPALRPVVPLLGAGLVCLSLVAGAVVASVLVLVLFVVWTTGAAVGLSAIQQFSPDPSSLSWLVVAGGLVSSLSTAGVWYLASAVVARYAATSSVRAGLEPTGVVRVGVHSGFFVGVVVAAGMVIVVGGVGLVLSPWYVGIPLVWYGLLGWGYAVGRGYELAEPGTRRSDGQNR